MVRSCPILGSPPRCSCATTASMYTYTHETRSAVSQGALNAKGHTVHLMISWTSSAAMGVLTSCRGPEDQHHRLWPDSSTAACEVQHTGKPYLCGAWRDGLQVQGTFAGKAELR